VAHTVGRTLSYHHPYTIENDAHFVAKLLSRYLDVHFISSLPVILRRACKAWRDREQISRSPRRNSRDRVYTELRQVAPHGALQKPEQCAPWRAYCCTAIPAYSLVTSSSHVNNMIC